MRRNPVIADLFHRMKYMERRGSGLRKIVSETEKLPGYSEAYKPEFSSTATDFRVILKNVNYHHDYSIMDINQVKTQVKTQVTTFDEFLVFCSTPHSKAEIADYCGYKNNKNFTKKYLRPLLDSGTLKMTIPTSQTVEIKNILPFAQSEIRSRTLGFIPIVLLLIYF